MCFIRDVLTVEQHTGCDCRLFWYKHFASFRLGYTSSQGRCDTSYLTKYTWGSIKAMLVNVAHLSVTKVHGLCGNALRIFSLLFTVSNLAKTTPAVLPWGGHSCLNIVVVLPLSSTHIGASVLSPTRPALQSGMGLGGPVSPSFGSTPINEGKLIT